MKIEPAAVKGICSRARNGCDDAPGGLPEFGAVIVSENAKFLQGVHSQLNSGNTPGCGAAKLVLPRPVDNEVVVVHPLPADGNAGPPAGIRRLDSVLLLDYARL